MFRAVSSTPKLLLWGETGASVVGARATASVLLCVGAAGVGVFDEWTAAMAAMGCKKIKRAKSVATNWRIAMEFGARMADIEF